MGAETATRGKARASERGRERERNSPVRGLALTRTHTQTRAHTHLSLCHPATTGLVTTTTATAVPELARGPSRKPGRLQRTLPPPRFHFGKLLISFVGVSGFLSPPPPSPSAIVVPVVYLGLWLSESVATFWGEGAGNWSLLRQWRWLGVPSDSLPPPLPPNPLSLPPSLTRLPRRSQPRVNG